MADRVRASIVGASGYTGGELLRLLLSHPEISVQQVTSERLDGQFVHFTHPNLRLSGASGRPPIKFTASASLQPCDLLFLCLPHGGAMGRIESFAAIAPRIVDLSADLWGPAFEPLKDPARFAEVFLEHGAPTWPNGADIAPDAIYEDLTGGRLAER